MIDFIRKIPNDAQFSDSLRKESEGVIIIKLFGYNFYVPVTLEFKRIFKIKRVNNRLIYPSYKLEKYLEDFLRNFIASVYYQVRDTVGAEIHAKLNQELSEGFQQLFEKSIGKRINTEFEQKLLEKK